MPQDKDDPCTAETVHAWMASIPSKLVKCRRNRHEWIEKKYKFALDYNSERTSDPRRVTQIEYVDECNVCELLRHHIWLLRTREGTGYWYSNYNPALRAPAGVWSTGVSVRSELQAADDEKAAQAVILELKDTEPKAKPKAARSNGTSRGRKRVA